MTAPAAAPISAQALDAALRAQLAPEQLQVIDESGQHAGHAAANSSGFGTHFRVRIAAAYEQTAALGSAFGQLMVERV